MAVMFLLKIGILSAHSIPSPLTASDGVTVILVGRMHPVVVKLPPLLGALSAPLILFCNIKIILLVNGLVHIEPITCQLHQI